MMRRRGGLVLGVIPLILMLLILVQPSRSVGGAASGSTQWYGDQSEVLSRPVADENRTSDALQQAQNVEFVGQVGGITKTVAVRGNYAYLGVGSRLLILDVSDATHPVLVGQTAPLPGVISHVVIANAYAYLAAGPAGLRIIDIASLTNPVEVGFHDTPGLAKRVALASNKSYIADGGGGLRIIGIANPAAPVELGYSPSVNFFRSLNAGGTVDVAVAGNFAYVIDSFRGDAGNGYRYLGTLRVIDISASDSPVVVATYENNALAHQIIIHIGNHLYVGSHAEMGSYFSAIDISTPQHPAWVGQSRLSGLPRDMAVSGRHVFVATGLAGLRVINIADPTRPSEVGGYDASAYLSGVVVAGSHAYAIEDSGLRVLGVSSPASPAEVGRFRVLGSGSSVALMGDHVYVEGARSLNSVDVRNPARPSLVGFSRVTGGLTGIADMTVAGNYAYIVDHVGLLILNITNPANITTMSYFDFKRLGDLAFNPNRITIERNRVYVASSNYLRIIDVTDPADPVPVGSIVGHVEDVAVSGDYAYLARGMDGLRIFNVSNPANPVEVGRYSMDQIISFCRVVVTGSYAYVINCASSNLGLRIINISDPTQPILVGYHPGYLNYIPVAGNYAVATSSSGSRLILIDIANPTSPTEVGFFDMPGTVGNVVAAGDLIYVANGDAGLWILRRKEVKTNRCFWTGTWQQVPSHDEFPMFLTQNEAVITGTYALDDRKIEGTVSGTQFSGRWAAPPSFAESSNAGRFVFTMADGCNAFSGTWGFGSSNTDGGLWGFERTAALAEPPTGAVLSGLSLSLAWQLPEGSTQYHLRVAPYNNDGPAIDLVRNAESSFALPAPQIEAGNYILLPDMTYSWRIRATSKSTFAPPDDPSWGRWSPARSFRTPVRRSASVGPLAPANGAIVPAVSQTLQWESVDRDVFYYEIQASGDSRFDADPLTATSFVWWNLIHGGRTDPVNSWRTPDLQEGTTYYWRVRPRVQGDGRPVVWGPTWSFRTP